MKVFLLPLFLFCSVIAFGIGNTRADFSPNKSAGCPPLVVNFANLSSNATTWYWDFGNGNTSTLENPSATFLQSGLYQVTLAVQNGTETDSMIQTIEVFKVPVANFITTGFSPCSFDTIHFQPNVTLGDAPIIDYAWGFGNGIAIGDSVASYFYGANGTYPVTFVIQDTNGCSANKTIPVVINVFPSPVAAFTASPTSTCNTTQLVAFKNHSSGNGLSYVWNLDHGVTTTEVDPTHTYDNESYKVVLTATDSNGCQGQASTVVTVEPMSADFSASPDLACTNQKIQFTNTSNYNGTQWYWDFGDGTTSTVENPIKVYTTPGIYSVTFKISQSPTCADSITIPNLMNIRQGSVMPLLSIAADSTESCHPPLTVHFTTPDTVGLIGYLWDFGDGNGSNAVDPTNTYTSSGVFTITLTVMDSSGCIEQSSFPDFISTSGPGVKFSTYVGCPGTPLEFNNTTSGAASFSWAFGDGSTSTETDPWHSYKTFGMYMVTLTATSGIGCVNSDTSYVSIDSSLFVNFGVNATFSPCPPFVAEFQNKSATTGLTYLWDFGDGYTDTKTNPIHIYFYPGVYTVTLIGYAKSGCNDTMVYKNLITVQGPTGSFLNNPTVGCLPLKVNYFATISSDTKSVWSDLGDGTVILDTLSFSHYYYQQGVFHPQFVLTDYVGCSVSYPLDSVVAHPLPVISLKDTSICTGAIVNVTLDSSNTYSWLPSSYLSCDSCGSLTITAPDTTAYQVLATTQFGCQARANFTLSVEPLPHLLDSTVVNLCPHDSLHLFVGTAPKITWAPATFLDDSATATPVCTPLNSVHYLITAYNHLGCSVNTGVQVNVKDKVLVTSPAMKVCQDDTVQLQTTLGFGSDVGVAYNWSPPQYLDSSGVPNPVATLGSKTVNFQLIASSGHCSSDTQSVAVTVVATPDILVSGPVTTTADADVQLFAISHEDLTYQWYSTDSISCPDCSRTNIFPTKSQTVYVEGRNSFGCEVMDSVPIEVFGCNPASVFIPNTFTPNNDGLNDKLFIRSSSLSSLKYFRIYDQWGKMVFETSELDQGWDGTSNGKNVSTGVYVYELEGQCQNGYDIVKSGNVTAIR